MKRFVRWLKRVGIAALLLFFAAVVSVIVVVLPFVRDDMAIDQIVVAVVLDWRDFGLAAANERLQYELDHRGIGMHVGDEHCLLEQEPDGTRVVRCDWSVDIAIPGFIQRMPLKFGSKAEMRPSGELL
jgi:hypothetical protein